MSENDDSEEHKQKSQAVADQPQEEFISPENVPSKPEPGPATEPPEK